MKNTLGLVFFPAFDWMISPAHPERQERLLYTRDQLEEELIVKRLRNIGLVWHKSTICSERILVFQQLHV